ncbi:MAG: response regulator [Lentisphaeraceae bacterium]|nr:response regulator [Lentisphaeraceae bacterium]
MAAENDYILIVDDEPQNLKVVGALLQDLGYNFSFANSGQAAIERIESRIPSLILLDVMMPVMNGFEVCEKIKKNEKTRHIPILMLSGLSDEEDIAKGLNLGADDFLSKPIRPLELQARVRTLLRTKQLFDDLQAANKVTENLVQMIAHDVRAPLTVVKCISSILKNKPDPKIKDFGERIHVSSNRAENMINDMLSVMNYSGEALKLTLEKHKLVDFFSSIVDSIMPLVELNKMSLKLDLGENSETEVYIDPYLISRCIENLVLNAIKYSKTQTDIILSIELRGENWCFKVIDKGVGLPVNKEILFNLHQTGEQNERGSHGIGLSFCKLVSEAHNGSIRSYNNEPTGAVFEVELPLKH